MYTLNCFHIFFYDFQLNFTQNSHLYFSVGMQNNPFLRWGGQTTHLNDILIPFPNTTEYGESEDGYRSVNLTETMPNATEFRLLIRAHVIDNKGCYGRESNFTYKGKLVFCCPRLFDTNKLI